MYECEFCRTHGSDACVASGNRGEVRCDNVDPAVRRAYLVELLEGGSFVYADFYPTPGFLDNAMWSRRAGTWGQAARGRQDLSSDELANIIEGLPELRRVTVTSFVTEVERHVEY